jgi:hypothetical protein
MSTSTARPVTRKPLSLSIRGQVRIDPNRPAERFQHTSVAIPAGMHQRLSLFIASVHRRTGRTVTQRSVLVTALQEFLDRNRGWLAPADPPTAEQ